MSHSSESQISANPKALLPLAFFCFFYFGLSLVIGDFYKIPMPVAFLAASFVAIAIDRTYSLTDKTELFARGMGRTDIMVMCIIFILAGAFTATAKALGGVDAVVIIAQHYIPSQFMLPGLFAVSALISLAIGTSCGTIAAVVPIAVGLGERLGLDLGMTVGATIGGAMFGDNLSLISDTTIAATRTQAVAMRDKLLYNLKIVLVPALLTILIFMFISFSTNDVSISHQPIDAQMVMKTVPYILLLFLAVIGFNVMTLLAGGIVFNLILGWSFGVFSSIEGMTLIGKGMLDMSETLIVALLAGGLMRIIDATGGIAYIIEKTRTHIGSKAQAEFGICAIVGIVNIFTANNTVAIITSGGIAKKLATEFSIDARRSASFLDCISCSVQGLLPYGAQILIALGLSKSAQITFTDLLPGLLYPVLLAFSVFSVITFRKN